jgi:arginine:ornithine antiporter/lysine permease
LKYLLMAVLFLTVGIPVFIWSRRENNPMEKAFTHRELWFACLMVVTSLITLFLFWRGILTA